MTEDLRQLLNGFGAEATLERVRSGKLSDWYLDEDAGSSARTCSVQILNPALLEPDLLEELQLLRLRGSEVGASVSGMSVVYSIIPGTRTRMGLFTVG